METVQATINQARAAVKRGDLVTGKALMERARAIKAGPVALEQFERQAEAAMLAPVFVKARASERRETALMGAAMKDAFKAEALAEIDPAAEKLANELHGGNYAETVFDKHAQYTRYLKGAPLADLPAAKLCVLSPRQLLEAIQQGMSASEVKGVMNEAQSAQGGFMLAETLSETVMGRATSLCVVRQRATVDTAGPGGSLAYAIWQGSGDVYSTALRGVWTSELQASAAENPRLGKASLEPKLWRLKIITSRSLLEDAGPRMMGSLHSKVAEAYAAAEDCEMLTGAGVTAPLGILATDAGVLRNSDVRVTNSGAATSITADAVIALIYSLPMQYRGAPGFCITCKAATVVLLRTLKDGAGRYLFDDRDHTLCGYPLVESESMPTIAANAYPLLCGDFAGYGIGDRLGLSIQLMQDSTLADTDSAALYVRRRVGGAPVEGYRFAALKVSA